MKSTEQSTPDLPKLVEKLYRATHAPLPRLIYPEVKALVDQLDQVRPVASMTYSSFEVEQMIRHLERAADYNYIPLPYDTLPATFDDSPNTATTARRHNGLVETSTNLTRIFGA